MSGKRPTLKVLAQHTGLATATVSRALKDDPAIKASTRELVHKAAKELGYVRDIAAVRLRTGKAHTIAAVFPVGFELSTHSSRLMNAAASALRKADYTLTIKPYFEDEGPMSGIKEIVETRSADGILFNSLEDNDVRVRYLLEKNFPFATHGRCDLSVQHDYYDFDNFGYGKAAVSTLCDRGRSNIWMVAPPQHLNYGHGMTAGATLAAQQRQVAFSNLQKVTSDDQPEDIFGATVQLLRSNPKIDGFIVPCAPAGMAVLNAIDLVGRSAGDDIDVCIKEAPDVLSWFGPKPILFPEDVRAAGHFLAEALLARIRNPKTKPQQFLESPLLAPDIGALIA